jgi:hypothetical protein
MFRENHVRDLYFVHFILTTFIEKKMLNPTVFESNLIRERFS